MHPSEHKWLMHFNIWVLLFPFEFIWVHFFYNFPIPPFPHFHEIYGRFHTSPPHRSVIPFGRGSNVFPFDIRFRLRAYHWSIVGGEYIQFVEHWSRESKEQSSIWLDALWSSYFTFVFVRLVYILSPILEYRCFEQCRSYLSNGFNVWSFWY